MCQISQSFLAKNRYYKIINQNCQTKLQTFRFYNMLQNILRGKWRKNCNLIRSLHRYKCIFIQPITLYFNLFNFKMFIKELSCIANNSERLFQLKYSSANWLFCKCVTAYTECHSKGKESYWATSSDKVGVGTSKQRDSNVRRVWMANQTENMFFLRFSYSQLSFISLEEVFFVVGFSDDFKTAFADLAKKLVGRVE